MGKVSCVLVPVKGRTTDAEAIGVACNIAKKDKGTVYAIYVIEVKRSLPIDAEDADQVARGDRVLEQAEAAARAHGYQIRTEILQAREVGPAIVDEATERDIDLIILGVEYKRRFGQFDTGRTVPYVLRNAPCRVWVMREPATPESELRK